MRLYLDSSVVVAAFAPEINSTRAWDLLDAAHDVVVSELTVTETRVSLIRKRKRGALTSDEVRQAMDELALAIQDGLFRVEPVPVMAFRAAEALADQVSVQVRAMDAVHVALAIRLEAELATFDDDQAIAARQKGVSVHGAL